MAGAPQQPLTFNDVFEEEEHMEPKEAHTIHHIRANSSIMHLDKILGELPTVLGACPRGREPDCQCYHKMPGAATSSDFG